MIMVKAMREASSMQTWTNSQPAPLPRDRALLCPLRSPVMRWPTWWKRPSFLMSMDELAGVLAFVAPHRLGRLEVPEAAQAGAYQCVRPASLMGVPIAAPCSPGPCTGGSFFKDSGSPGDSTPGTQACDDASRTRSAAANG